MGIAGKTHLGRENFIKSLNKIFGNEMDYTGSEFFIEFLLNPGKFWNFDGIYRILAESLKGWVAPRAGIGRKKWDNE